jgi:CarD family transcriptional regulator
MMFKVNDTVIYGTQGIFKIAEISSKDLTGDMVEYFVLKPIYRDACTIFVPAGNEKLIAQMRGVISAEEVDDLIEQIPDTDCAWIEDEKERWVKFEGIVSGGDRTEIIMLIRTLSQHKLLQKDKGKKLHFADEHIMSCAEKILNEEFGYILNIRPDRVGSYIQEKIDSKNIL